MSGAMRSALVIGGLAAILGGSAAGARTIDARPVRLELPPATARTTVSFTATMREELPPLSIARQVANGRHWRLETARGPVHVWIPHGYAAETAVTVVYVHGYYTDVDAAWFGHQLSEQFALSGINAMFIACSAPSRLVEPVAWPSLSRLLATVRTTTRVAVPKGRVVAVGHSGAHRTLERWLADRRLDTVVLVDAGYGDLWDYRRWLLRSPEHRLINVADDTIGRSDALHRSLPRTLVLDGFPAGELPAEAARARVLYVRTDLGHMPLVTGGLVLPAVLRALRVKRVLTAPLPYPLQ